MQMGIHSRQNQTFKLYNSSFVVYVCFWCYPLTVYSLIKRDECIVIVTFRVWSIIKFICKQFKYILNTVIIFIFVMHEIPEIISLQSLFDGVPFLCNP